MSDNLKFPEWMENEYLPYRARKALFKGGLLLPENVLDLLKTKEGAKKLALLPGLGEQSFKHVVEWAKFNGMPDAKPLDVMPRNRSVPPAADPPKPRIELEPPAFDRDIRKLKIALSMSNDGDWRFLVEEVVEHLQALEKRRPALEHVPKLTTGPV